MNKYIAILLLVFSGSAISEVTTFICNYPIYSDKEGRHKSNENFELVFILDSAAEKTYMKGNNGTVEIQFVMGVGHIAFIQATDTGNIMTTAITLTPNMDSVHSRNSVIFGNLLPSQYYGTCEKK